MSDQSSEDRQITQPAVPERLWQGLVWALVLMVLALLTLQLIDSARTVTTLGAAGALVDFDAFYIVGQLTLERRPADAYDLEIMARIQGIDLGQEGFMPWNYPPPFHLITAALAALPRGLAFGLFTGLTALAYLVALALLAGRAFPTAVLLVIPPLAITFSLGQSSFLIAALAGASCWLTLRADAGAQDSGRAEGGRADSGRAGGSGWAGYPLGLMVIKPHLGLGLGLHALAAGHWPVIWRAAATVAALAGLSTLVLGTGIWGPFVQALRAAGGMVDQGGYPMYRMLSIQALARTLGLPMATAALMQTVVALAACGALVWIVRRRPPLRHSLAAACLVPPLISPYFYDYDMLIAGIGLALLAPDLIRRTALAERLALVLLAWLAGGWGTLSVMLASELTQAERFAWLWGAPAVGAAAYLLLIGVVARILTRPAP